MRNLFFILLASCVNTELNNEKRKSASTEENSFKFTIDNTYTKTGNSTNSGKYNYLPVIYYIVAYDIKKIPSDISTINNSYLNNQYIQQNYNLQSYFPATPKYLLLDTLMTEEQPIPPNSHFIIKVNVQGISAELSEKLKQLTTQLSTTPIEVTCISSTNIDDYKALKDICNYTIPTQKIHYLKDGDFVTIGDDDIITSMRREINGSVFPKFESIKDSTYIPPKSLLDTLKPRSRSH